MGLVAVLVAAGVDLWLVAVLVASGVDGPRSFLPDSSVNGASGHGETVAVKSIEPGVAPTASRRDRGAWCGTINRGAAVSTRIDEVAERKRIEDSVISGTTSLIEEMAHRRAVEARSPWDDPTADDP